MSPTLKIVRENLGLTQLEVSTLMGIPINTIRNWEQEARMPRDWALHLLIDRLLRESNHHQPVVDETTGILSFLTIKNTVSKIASQYDIERVYLFGSYVNGQAMEHSDVDFFIESDLFGLDYFEFVEQLRNSLKKKVEVLSYRTIQADSTIDQEIQRTKVLIYERQKVY